MENDIVSNTPPQDQSFGNVSGGRSEKPVVKQKCAYCLKPFNTTNKLRTIDHIVPRSKGGANKQNNKVAVCLPCNRAKKNDSLEEFFARNSSLKGAANCRGKQV